jgi:membrane-bound serine protease (ClpP class)
MMKICILILSLILLLPIVSSASENADADKTAQILHIDGVIGPATASFVKSGIETAHTLNAELVILLIDTPGGLVDSMRTIIRAVLSSPIPVAVYVSPSGARAASAGTYILYASHIAAMAPGTNLGAATPVQIGGSLSCFAEKTMGKRENTSGKDEKNNQETPSRKETGDAMDAMEKKIVNDSVAYIRSLAQLRGRNADWAEQSVREGASLPVDEALKFNVIDLVANDVNDLLRKIDGREVTIENRQIILDTADLNVQTIEPSWRIKMLYIITNPNIAFILMLIGVYGIIFEFSSPGSIGPGVIGVICLLFGLYALNVLPVNYAGLGLLIFGLALMTAEAFVPSFGILGISGFISFILAATLLFDSDVPGFHISLPVILVTAITSGGLLIFLLAYVWKTHRRPVITGNQGLIGKEGRVVTWSGGSGYVQLGGERWKAHSEENLKPDDCIQVKERIGLEVRVKKTTQSTP